MKVLFVAVVVSLVVLAACSSSAPLTRTVQPDIEATVAAGVSATIRAGVVVSDTTTDLPVIERERQVAADYLRRLYVVTEDFYSSLDRAGVRRNFSQSDSRFSITGDLEAAQRVTRGFVGRLAGLEPSGGPIDLASAHSIALSIAQREERWLNDYAAALDGGDAVKIRELETSYAALFPVSDIQAADRLFRGIGYDYNLEVHRAGGLRVTLLHPDFKLVENERDRVQAAMRLFMADTGATTVTSNAVATADFSASTPALYPSYLRDNPTSSTYTWDVAGNVEQVAIGG